MRIPGIYLSLRVAITCFMLIWLCMPAPAHAGAPPPLPAPPPIFDVDVCNSNLGLNFQAWEYTSKVVACLKGTVITAVVGMLDVLSVYMFSTVGAMMVLAIAIFGIRITGGEDGLKPKAIGFLLRLGLVALFSWNLGGYALAVFDITDQLIGLVTVGYEPWSQIDALLGRLLGFGQTVLLFQGLIGLIGSALFSSTAGIVLFLTGSMAMLDILFFIFRVVFTYLTAIVLIGFMIIISPLIIPLALFFWTERYFKKWLDILIAAMITPMLLFAFLWMFMGIFDTLLAQVFTILGGDNFSAYWRVDRPMFSWLMPTDPNLSTRLEVITSADSAGNPAMQTNLVPWLRRGMNSGMLNMPGVDFGENGVNIFQQLVLAFVSLWIFSSLMKSMIKKIPEIANNIAGAVSGLSIAPLSIERSAMSGIERARNFAGNMGRR